MFAKCDFKLYFTDLKSQWTQYLESKKEEGHDARVKMDLKNALYLGGYSCPQCYALGSCAIFCRNAKCQSNLDDVKKSKDQPKVAGPGTGTHFQNFRVAKIRVIQQIPDGQAIDFKTVLPAMEKQVKDEYRKIHNLAVDWKQNNKHGVVDEVKFKRLTPEEVFDRQYLIPSLDLPRSVLEDGLDGNGVWLDVQSTQTVGSSRRSTPDDGAYQKLSGS